MASSSVRLRLALLSGAAFFVAAVPSQAQTICSQAADGTVTCTEGGEVVASGTVTPGTVTTGPGLVVPLTASPVDGTITGSISTDGSLEAGVSLNTGSSIDFVQQGAVSTTGDDSPAILAIAGTSAIVAVGDVSTAGASSAGIVIEAGEFGFDDFPSGSINLTCGNVLTTGADADAVTLRSGGSVTAMCGNIRATGAGSSGFDVFSEDIDVAIGDVLSDGRGVWIGHLDFGRSTTLVGDVTTTGNDGDGVTLNVRDGFGQLTCGNVSTSGDGATGLQTFASDGGGSVICGDIATSGDNSAAASIQEMNFTLGNLTTGGAGSAGLQVSAFFGGSGTVGDVSTAGANSAGVELFSDNFSLVAGDITTAGADSVGVRAEGRLGQLDMELGQVTTTGANSHGIDITYETNSNFESLLSVSVAGVSVAGAGADGIRIDTIGGDVAPTLVLGGDVTSADGTAILVASGGTFDLDIAENVLVSGRTGGIIFDGGTVDPQPAGNLILDVAGAVSGTEGAAIQGLGGDATVTIASTGSVSGSLIFGDGDDVVSNAGLVGEIGASDFGAGNDLFTNSNMLAVNGSAAFAGLEVFGNVGGTIDMQDGAPDDRLEVSGNFAGGDGSSVLLDVSRSLDAADVLAIGGEASGETLIDIDWIDSDAPVNAGGVLLIEGASDPDLFTVTGLEDFGLFALALREQDGNLFLMAAIDPAAADLLLLGSVVPDTWYQSFDALRASIAGRGSLLPRLGLWGQAYGGSDRTGESGTVELFGSEVAASTRLQTERLGFQAGLDGSLGAVLVGATAGYEKARSDAGLASDIDAEGYNVGAYAAVGAAIGPYAVVTLKHDRLDLAFDNSALPVPDLDGTSTGGDVEAGWRGSLGLASLDLAAGLSVVRSKLDGFAIDGTDFDPESGTSARGRLGGRATLAGPFRPFAEARLFHEFGDGSELGILSGEIEERLDGADRGTWARLEAGIGGGNDRPLVSGWVDLGDRKGWGLRAGLRF